jgi:hypothetical protein
MLRCEICDFTQLEGSGYAGRASSQTTKVQYSKEYHGTYCTTCLAGIQRTSYDLKAAA